MTNGWTLGKPMASLSTCHLGVLSWMAILLILVIFYVIALFEQMINIARFIEMWMFVCVCVSAYVEVEVALRLHCHSLFHTPFRVV